MAQEAQWGGGAAMTEKQLQALIEWIDIRIDEKIGMAFNSCDGWPSAYETELRRKLHEIFLMDGNQELLQAETISDL
jgi:hypothetical protein